MFELGKKQTLIVVKKVDFGVYLADTKDASDKEKVLLPIKQVPEGTKEGDQIQVFIYKDSQDRPIATVNEPALTVGEIAVLKVKEVGKIGAFLDWHLEKDLLLPFREQTKTVHPGEEVLVTLYIDKSNRLAATMKVYHYLKKNSPYNVNDMVQGYIYEISDRFGAFVAVDYKYSGLIPKKECQADYKAGQILNLRVTEVKEDGKLNLSARQKVYLQVKEDADSILEIIREDFGGVLPFDDTAEPEKIQMEFGLSKNAFKRAVGNLYKKRIIDFKDGKIYVK